jgi:hypothetical protein
VKNHGRSAGNQVSKGAIWAVWEPLIEEMRLHGKTQPKGLRRTISAILWRHQNGAKWRCIPDDLGPGGWRRKSFYIGPRPVFGSACWRWCSSGYCAQYGFSRPHRYPPHSKATDAEKKSGPRQGARFTQSTRPFKAVPAALVAMAPRLA